MEDVFYNFINDDSIIFENKIDYVGRNIDEHLKTLINHERKEVIQLWLLGRAIVSFISLYNGSKMDGEKKLNKFLTPHEWIHVNIKTAIFIYGTIGIQTCFNLADIGLRPILNVLGQIKHKKVPPGWLDEWLIENGIYIQIDQNKLTGDDLVQRLNEKVKLQKLIQDCIKKSAEK